MAIFRTKKAEETENIRLPRHIAIILDGNGRGGKNAAFPGRRATPRGRRLSAESPPTART